MGTVRNESYVGTKTLQDYLVDDPSLRDQISYDEFVAGKASPRNSDVAISEAFDAYMRVVHGEC